MRKEFEAHYAKPPQHIPHLDSDQLILDSARMDTTSIQSNGSHQRSVDGSLALTNIFGRQTPTFDENELNELVGPWNSSHEAPYVITDTDDNKVQKISQLEAMQATLNAFSSKVPENSAGADVVNKVLYIGEYFRFHMTVRDSRYRGYHGESIQNKQSKENRILRRAVLVCNKK